MGEALSSPVVRNFGRTSMLLKNKYGNIIKETDNKQKIEYLKGIGYTEVEEKRNLYRDNKNEIRVRKNKDETRSD